MSLDKSHSISIEVADDSHFVVAWTIIERCRTAHLSKAFFCVGMRFIQPLR
jgi:hypothetical protein